MVKAKAAYLQFTKAPTEENRKLWLKEKLIADMWFKARADLSKSYMELKWYRHGEKTGKILANMAKAQENKNRKPISLRGPQGQILKSPQEVSDIFATYFQKVYSKNRQTVEGLDDFLKRLNLPKINQDSQDLLNAPITEPEVLSTIKSLKNFKAPGPDGYTAEFFKILKGEIVQPLTEVFNKILKDKQYLPTGTLAYVRLIHKEAKYAYNIKYRRPPPHYHPWCPKCKEPEANLIHCVWDCPYIDHFWDKVLRYANYMCNKEVSKQRDLCVFNYFETKEHNSKIIPSELFHIILIVAKKVIFQKLISPHPPIVANVKEELLKLFLLEKLHTLQEKEKRSSKFFKKWRHFIQQTFSQQEIDSLMEHFKYSTCGNPESGSGPESTAQSSNPELDAWEKVDACKSGCVGRSPAVWLQVVSEEVALQHYSRYEMNSMFSWIALVWMLIGWKFQKARCSSYDLTYKPAVFDDQYIGCSDELSDETMPKVLSQEKSNQQFNEAWRLASKEWNKKVPHLELPDEFEDEHGIALLVFTNHFPEGNPIHTQFNGNLTIAGASRKDYMDKFHFKALHFYLTRALQILKPDCSSNYTTFRGSHNAYKLSTGFKFGRFTSSSLTELAAQVFGTESVFQITTCFGADIGNVSFFPREEEVLIPPTEKFKYVTKDDTTYVVQSMGQTCSYFNCAILGAEKQAEAICISDATKLPEEGKKKKSQVQISPVEQEDRLSILEDLIAQNHEKMGLFEKVIVKNYREINSNYITLINLKIGFSSLEGKVEELTEICDSEQSEQQRAQSQALQQTTNVLNLLLKQELDESRNSLDKEKEKLYRVSDKLDTLSESLSEAQKQLRDLEKAVQGDKTRITDFRETMLQNLELVTVQQARLRLLEAARADLEATVYNLSLVVTIIAVVGLCIWAHRYQIL
ncbi:uncharacterized protein [Hyperolius riggenbachi]|uniref:uncharacterized protein n=1 Tax=Hyperolius riggenbachi TaxID=752182 RepID=UPI0035A37E64